MARRNGRKTAERIALVEQWFRQRGYTVVFEKGIESQIHPKKPKFAANSENRKEVWIDSAPSLECQLHTILHEAGHLIVGSRKNYSEKYPYGYPAIGTAKAKTVAHWVHLIGEEFEAWEEGFALARKLEIPIRKNVWEQHRCPALMSYFRKAIEKKGGFKASASAVRSVIPVVELFWLDDERPAPEGWIWVHNGLEALRLLALHAAAGTSSNTVWSLDHDLGESSPSGYNIAQWIEERTHTDPKYVPPRVLIHTANPVGRENIRRCVESTKRALAARQDS